MAVANEMLAQYLRLPPDNLEELEIYINAAVDYSAAAGVTEPEEGKDLYHLLIMSLAANYYENRGLSVSGTYAGTAEETRRSMLNSFILNLRYRPKKVAGETEP